MATTSVGRCGRTVSSRERPAATLASLLLVLAGYLAGLGYELSQPPVPAQNQQLASWLAARHLHTGLSSYWEANVVALASGFLPATRYVIAAPAPA